MTIDIRPTELHESMSLPEERNSVYITEPALNRVCIVFVNVFEYESKIRCFLLIVSTRVPDKRGLDRYILLYRILKYLVRFYKKLIQNEKISIEQKF